MINQTVTIKSPIKVKQSKNYLLIIEDANLITHYWHRKHENKYGKFENGQYDGWSRKMSGIKNKKKQKNAPKCGLQNGLKNS